MEVPLLLNITPIYVAALGLVFIVLTMRAGLYRAKTKIYLGVGDDPEMLRRMRGQANFVETVPIAIFLIVIMEVLGASDIWLHGLGGTLLVSRIAHYLGLTQLAPPSFRVVGMTATLVIILVSSIWVLSTML
jgi:uncharacterized membrane protein YecN with MAPEG domain